MAVTLVVLSTDTDPLPRITFDAPRVVIGRGEGADFRLPDPSVSHRHASLRQRGSDYLLVDEGSTNGTFVGSVRLAPQSPRILRNGDRLRVGRIEIEARIEPGAIVTHTPLATRELALGLVSRALAAQGEVLSVRVEAHTRAKEGAAPTPPGELNLDVLGRDYIVGRGANCDLVLPDPDCSRRHIAIVRRGTGLFVRDLGSKNGSQLDGSSLPTNHELSWPPDTELRAGSSILRYENPLSGALEDLERAADEPVTGQPTITSDLAGDPSSEDPSAPEEATEEFDPPARISATATPAPHKRRRTFDPALTDFLVGTLAVAVLGLSLLGLYWLIG